MATVTNRPFGTSNPEPDDDKRGILVFLVVMLIAATCYMIWGG
jgi:hypothetical protein